jgi:hypothetical protein
MAVAAYDSDLTSSNGGEIAVGNTSTDSGTWDESSNASWDDAGPPDDETNFYINYTNCISAQFTKTGQGTIIYDDGGTTHSVDTDGAVLIWYFWASPASLSTYANGGIKILAGSSLGDFYAWDCGGSDFEPNPLGGWYCYALNPAIGSADDTVGTPGSAPYDNFGIATNATAQARGYPSAVNAIRVGRCTLEVTNGQAGDYGTFSGMESFDTSTNARYGLFQDIFGAYRWQGLMQLGTSSTSVDFRDGNVSINVANTPNVTSSFNKIEINNSSSNVEWTNVIMTSPGVNNTVAATASRGDFNVVDNATVDLEGCSFTDMGTFTFNDGTNSNTITGTTFRRCNLVTTGGATFTGCTFDDTNDSTKAVIVSSPANAAKISDSTFISGGTGHGLEIGGTAADFTLTGCDFSGYDTADPGTAANKAIYVNIASGTVNLTISGGSGISADHHVRTAGATVNILTGSVTLTVTAKTAGGTAVENALVYLQAADGTGPFPFEDTVTITNSGTTATVSHTSHGMASNDYVFIDGASHHQNNGVFQITVTGANAYTYTMASAPGSDPTGTIESTFVALYGLTNASGIKTASRVYSADQNVTGWVRKSSASPYYKEGPLSGTVDSADGYTNTAVLVSDE